MTQTWSIVVFCFNEVETVGEVIERIVALCSTHLHGAYEVIVVDDGSTDGSHEKIQAVAAAHPGTVHVIQHEINRGIGVTLRDGYRAARYENITAIPADGQFDIYELLPYLSIPAHSFVSFYRKENVQYSSFRTILSATNKFINRWLNGIELKDVNWVKIYKTKAIQAFDWKLKSSLIESELCAKLLLTGAHPTEVPSIYHPRVAGKSKGASLPVVLQAMFETTKLVWAVQHFRYTRPKIDKEV